MLASNTPPGIKKNTVENSTHQRRFSDLGKVYCLRLLYFNPTDLTPESTISTVSIFYTPFFLKVILTSHILVASNMGINSAADKWKWVAINIMDHTMPKMHGLLDILSQAVDPTAIISLIKETEATMFVIKCTFALLFYIFVLTIILLHTAIKNRTRIFHLNYVRSQYGGTVETMARTYANLMRFHSERVQREGIGIDAERKIIFLIGAGKTAEAYLRFDHEFRNYHILQSLLPEGQPFVFRTIKDALRTLDVCCTSEEKLPKTLFILLLVSTRDPSRDSHNHETFQMPSSLRDHCYAIVGTGIGDDGVPPHRLSKSSKGPDGELLTESLPLGPENAGVRFY